MALGKQAVFDCRMVPLPNRELVKDYFRWRQEDAHRNALNAHCYWMLRKNGASVSEATSALEGKSVACKNELLFQSGINFNELPGWQKRGIGLYWDTVEKLGHNPVTNEDVITARQSIRVDYELPLGDAYSAFIDRFL